MHEATAKYDYYVDYIFSKDVYINNVALTETWTKMLITLMLKLIKSMTDRTGKCGAISRQY